MSLFKGVAPDDPNYIQLTENVYCHSPITNTAFGPYQAYPNFRDFLNFCEIKFFPYGHGNYNHLHFSTQVPVKEQFIVSKNIKLLVPYWSKVYILKVMPDYPYFSKFNELEFMFFDSLSNYKNIIYDGYFKDHKALIKGIKKQMDNLSQKYTINQDLIIKEAKLVTPELIKLLK